MSEDKNVKNSSKEFWKSLKEYYDDPAVLESKVHEFKEGVTDDFSTSGLSRMSRRNFLSLLTASAAFAATACSDYRDKGEIVPYTKRPEEVLPGVANYYASTCTGCSQACGILIKTREGRPVKVDGNPEHPVNRGKICATGQASILNLYDPERFEYPLKNGRKTGWDDIDNSVISVLNDSVKNNKKIAFISHSVNSPSLKKLLNDFAGKYPNTDFIKYELAGNKNRTDSWKECYGGSIMPKVRFDRAKIILSLESDFLSREGESIENARLFASTRNVDDSENFSRLYSVEGSMSLTGMNSDYRIRLRTDLMHEFVLSLVSEIIESANNELKLNGLISDVISKYSLDNFIKNNNLEKDKIKKLVSDLVSNKGKSVVYAGDILGKETHNAVNLLNELLGTENIYDFENGILINNNLSSDEEIKNLIDGLNNKKYSVVIHFDTNPVFHFPSVYDYSSAVKNAGNIITFAESENESTKISNFVIPQNHNYESWGDYETRNGVMSFQQPVIDPIFNTRQKESVILHWINEGKYAKDNYHKYVMNNFGSSKQEWFKVLHDGFAVKDKINSGSSSFNTSAEINFAGVVNTDNFVLTLSKSYFIGDGRYASNGWLQEIPHPVTKVAWDNYAAVSPATAEKLGVEINDLLEISVNGNTLQIPAMIQPGIAENQIDIETGYGRNVISDSGKNTGFNVNIFANPLSGSPGVISGLKVSKGNGSYKLVSTQEHHAVDDTATKDFHKIRKIIQEGTLEEYQKNPNFIKEEDEKIFSITSNYKYEDVKWGMSIDMNKCISCSVCVASCNVENNIPVVGKDQVERGREMHWMRIDRYYSGSPEEPEISNQPMLCQHCDNAPCENVCPVAATNHSPDGLNQMVYNRCVGTRYCLNNCPYKVRRFNFFNFRDHFADSYYQNELTGLVNNPEVTVRSRGVMEKCTFCVQRIMEARSDAIKDGREFDGSEVKTACQQACPTEAIVFGNYNAKDSEIAKKREHKLGYYVLEDLNVKPNVTYIAKLRNTSSEDV